MKKFLLTLCALLMAVSGAWADNLYLPTARVTSLEAGKQYMLYDAHSGRAGYIGGDGTSIIKTQTSTPATFKNEGGAYVWILEAGPEAGQYYFKNKASGNYYYINGNYSNSSTLSPDNKTAMTFTSYPNASARGTSTAIKADGTTETASDDAALWEIKNIGRSSDGTYWNGNESTFATWSDSHPYAIYEVDVVADIDVTDKLYRIFTYNNGTETGSTKYYLTSTGTLTATEGEAEKFTFVRTTSDQVVPTGYAYKLTGQSSGKRFTNPNGDARTNNIRTDTQNRDTYEGQIFYLNEDDNTYAVRASNANDATWHANAFWTVDADDDGSGLPDADYDLTLDRKHYIWQLEEYKTVTYHLVFNYETLASEGPLDNSTGTYNGVITSLPVASWERPCCSYTYEPSEITSDTRTVNVNMSWDGPFQISNSYDEAKWYIVDIHTNENQYTWYYDSETKEIQTPVIGKTEFAKIQDAHLWCFVGNPYNGFKIYNKAAGEAKTIRKESNGNTISYMSETDDRNAFQLSESASTLIDNAYCFKISEDNCYLNKQKNNGVNKLCGWTAKDEGSSCRFFPSGQFHLNYLNTFDFDAPVGAVGTSNAITADDARVTYQTLKATLTGDPFHSVTTVEATLMSSLAHYHTGNITLGTGFWRIVSAYPNFYAQQSKMAALYFDSSADRIKWSIDGLTSAYQVNNIMKLETGSADGTYNIKSPNANKYLYTTVTSANTDIGTLDATNKNDVTFSHIGNNTYLIEASVNSSLISGIHAFGHNNGSGTGDKITAWDTGSDGCSAWYIVKATTIPLTLNGPYDDNYYATLCLPFDVTISDASAYTLTLSGDKTYLTLNAVAENKVPAGTAVLLRGTEATATATINTGDAFNSGAPLSCALTGTYTNKDVTSTKGTDYFLGVVDSKIGFYHWKGTTLGANRAYLEAPTANIKGFALDFDNVETAISGVKQGDSSNTIYDLSGRQIAKPTKGLYIVNGKKVVIK